MAFAPFACGSVGADEEEGDGRGDNDDEGDDKGDTPGDVFREVLILHQGVEDCWHEEIGYTSSRVTETGGKRIGSADDILVEKSSRPHLTRDEATS